MADRNFLFEHELAAALHVPRHIARRLHCYGYLKGARVVIHGGCVAIYDAAKIYDLRIALQEGGALAGTLDYLGAIAREE